LDPRVLESIGGREVTEAKSDATTLERSLEQMKQQESELGKQLGQLQQQILFFSRLLGYTKMIDEANREK